MKRCLGLACAAVAAIGAARGPGEQGIKIKAPGGMTGTGKLVQRLLPNGSKLLTITMNLKGADGRSATIQTESAYEANGRPVRKLQKTWVSGSRSPETITATFGASGVALTVQVGEAKSQSTIAYPGEPINARSEFWFIRDQVAKGAVQSYMRLNLTTQKWQKTTSTAQGPSAVVIGGKSVQGQLVVTGGVKAWYGKGGRLLKMEEGGMVIEATD